MKSINRDIHRENRPENAVLAPDGLHGAALIASLAAQMPPTPGVYQMFDKDEAVLYIGKANNLRKRVVSYSRIANHGNRIARMITRVHDLATPSRGPKPMRSCLKQASSKSTIPNTTFYYRTINPSRIFCLRMTIPRRRY